MEQSFALLEQLRYFLINEARSERIPIRVTLPISEDYFSNLFIVVMQQAIITLQTRKYVCTVTLSIRICSYEMHASRLERVFCETFLFYYKCLTRDTTRKVLKESNLLLMRILYSYSLFFYLC